MIKQNNPLVSVCILAFNRPTGLKNTLNCITGQSYPNLEIIVSDDCSTDEMVEEIVKEFQKEDSRIKYFRQEKNLGIIGNHRFLLSKVAGKYMMWACDDDWWHRDYINDCVNALEENSEAVMCTTNSMLMRNNKEIYSTYFEDIQTLGIADPYVRYRKTFLNIFWWNNAFYGVFRVENINQGMLKNRFAFDYYFVLEMALQGQFMKLSPFYFKKTVGGIGNEIRDNLKAIGIKSNWFTKNPILNVVSFAILDTIQTYQLSTDRKLRQVYFLIKRYFQTQPMKGAKTKSKPGIISRLPGSKKYQEKKAIKQWFPDPEVREEVIKNHIPLHHVSYNQETKKLKLLKLGIDIQYPEKIWLLGAYEQIRKLVQEFDVKCRIDADDDLHLTSENITAKITEFSHVYTFYEILNLKIYNFQNDNRSIVFDVGMNIGIASLFFACKKNVEKVISFEPFEETFHTALNNFAINPAVSKKIHPNNFGLGNTNEKKRLPYHPNISEYAGVEKLPEEVISDRDLIIKEVEIELKTASAEISKYVHQNEGHNFVLKIDCEGCEYAIVKDLSEKDVLKYMDIVMIEWHYKGPDEITQTLTSAGFSVFELPNQNRNELGMIYAVKRHLS
jgi:FkbM family methyltransferase